MKRPKSYEHGQRIWVRDWWVDMGDMCGDFIDGQGVAFSEYRKHLPKRAADFSAADRVRDANLGYRYHWLWRHCQSCGRRYRDWVPLEMHHLTGGTKGRSDELTNVIMLCAMLPDGRIGCHRRYGAGSEEDFAFLLWRKWVTDRWNISWVRLAILRGRFLPEPLVLPGVQASYLRRIGQRVVQ